jgi:hypothetical protein
MLINSGIVELYRVPYVMPKDSAAACELKFGLAASFFRSGTALSSLLDM